MLTSLRHYSFLLLLCISFGAYGQAHPPKEPFLKDEWTKDYEPFRIAGNLYYVGSYDLGCYLITTPQGHILINTGVASMGPMLVRHIETLGFKVSDIKVILISQVHYDHVGTMAEMKKLTGARVMVDEKDAKVLADGGASDYLYSGLAPLFEPVTPDKLLRDKDTVKVGNMVVTLLHHPGHTKGSCSFSFTVRDEQNAYKVLIANMPSVIVEKKLKDVHTYPTITADYKRTFASLRSQHFDLWLAAHASQFGLQAKRKPGDAYNPELFRDSKGFLDALAELEKGFKSKQ